MISAATMPASAIARFENSITAWYWAGGTGPPWQSGQSGHPSPEPLSRTKAPDATFRYIAHTSTKVSRAKPLRSAGTTRATPRRTRVGMGTLTATAFQRSRALRPGSDGRIG